MDKIFKIIIIFEIILFSIFLFGYFFYEDLQRVDNRMSCETEAIRIALDDMRVIYVGGNNTSILVSGKEDLNS